MPILSHHFQGAQWPRPAGFMQVDARLIALVKGFRRSIPLQSDIHENPRGGFQPDVNLIPFNLLLIPGGVV